MTKAVKHPAAGRAQLRVTGTELRSASSSVRFLPATLHGSGQQGGGGNLDLVKKSNFDDG